MDWCIHRGQRKEGDGEGWSGVEQEHWRVSQPRTNKTRERERVVDLEITVKTLCPRLVIIVLHRWGQAENQLKTKWDDNSIGDDWSERMKRRGEEDMTGWKRERGKREEWECVWWNSLLGVSEHGKCVGLLDHHWLQGDLFDDWRTRWDVHICMDIHTHTHTHTHTQCKCGAIYSLWLSLLNNLPFNAWLQQASIRATYLQFFFPP